MERHQLIVLIGDLLAMKLVAIWGPLHEKIPKRAREEWDACPALADLLQEDLRMIRPKISLLMKAGAIEPGGITDPLALAAVEDYLARRMS